MKRRNFLTAITGVAAAVFVPIKWGLFGYDPDSGYEPGSGYKFKSVREVRGVHKVEVCTDEASPDPDFEPQFVENYQDATWEIPKDTLVIGFLCDGHHVWINMPQLPMSVAKGNAITMVQDGPWLVRQYV